MSHSHSPFAYDPHKFHCEFTPSRAGDPAARSMPTTDGSIDRALRCVPLPSGLMSRLNLLVCTMPDEPADQVDFLGC